MPEMASVDHDFKTSHISGLANEIDFAGIEPTPLETEKPGGELSRSLGFSRQPLLRCQPAFDVMKWLCVIIHLSVIAILSLFVMMQDIILHSPEDEAEYDSKYLKHGFASYIVTAFVALLTLTTQRLALRRQLHLPTTFTAKHNANSAWMGVGSASLTLLQCRDIGLRDTLASTWLPLLYLGTLSALHSPFEFQSIGLPDFSKAPLRNEVFTGSSALSTVFSLSTFKFTGLGSDGLGMIYDVPIPIPENQTQLSDLPDSVKVKVNATYFNVTCGLLEGSINNANASYKFFVNNDSQLALDIPAQFSQNSVALRTAPWGPGFGAGIEPASHLSRWPSTIVVLSTVPIRDSLNRIAQATPVIPPMTYTPFNSTFQQTSTEEIAALGCNLTIQPLPLVEIDKATFAVINSTASKTSSILSTFPSEVRQGLLDIDNSSDALIYVWGVLPTSAVSPLDFRLQKNCFANNSSCEPLYEAEQFVMESLNVFPDILLGKRISAAAIALVDLENVLSRMSAIEIWAELWDQMFANTLSSEGQESSANLGIRKLNENLVKDYEVFFSVVRVDAIAALALAIFLLILAVPSILDQKNPKIDSLGLLHIVYLINSNPKLHKFITNIDNPTISVLKREGNKLPVSFVEKFARGVEKQSAAPC